MFTTKFLALFGAALAVVNAVPTNPALGLEPRQDGCSNYDVTLYELADCSQAGINEQQCHAGGAACTSQASFPGGFNSIRVNSPSCETHLWDKEDCGSGGRYRVSKCNPKINNTFFCSPMSKYYIHSLVFLTMGLIVLAGANDCFNLDRATYGYQVIC